MDQLGERGGGGGEKTHKFLGDPGHRLGWMQSCGGERLKREGEGGRRTCSTCRIRCSRRWTGARGAPPGDTTVGRETPVTFLPRTHGWPPAVGWAWKDLTRLRSGVKISTVPAETGEPGARGEGGKEKRVVLRRRPLRACHRKAKKKNVPLQTDDLGQQWPRIFAKPAPPPSPPHPPQAEGVWFLPLPSGCKKKCKWKNTPQK